MPTKVEEQQQKSHKNLETTRQESRTARQKLIDAIMCDGKDVLSPSDIKEIGKAMTSFLKVQKKLGKAWFQNAHADARLFWKAGNRSVEEVESLIG